MQEKTHKKKKKKRFLFGNTNSDRSRKLNFVTWNFIVKKRRKKIILAFLNGFKVPAMQKCSKVWLRLTTESFFPSQMENQTKQLQESLLLKEAKSKEFTAQKSLESLKLSTSIKPRPLNFNFLLNFFKTSKRQNQFLTSPN